METTYTEFDGSLGQFFQAYASAEFALTCAMFTSVKLQDDAEKSDIDDLASNLLRHSPRIPANLDTSLDTPF
jgi:hypothetical protein